MRVRRFQVMVRSPAERVPRRCTGAERHEAAAGEGVADIEIGRVADVAAGGAALPVEGEADLVGRHVDLYGGAVEQDEAGAGGDGRAHRQLGAGLAAQQRREQIGGRAR
jgi:hypothetical protein